MLNILYVEDDDDYREETVNYLREYNLNVIDVNDPIKALEILKSEEIGLIISDYNMPHLDGSEFLEEVKKINPLIKFIIMSAFGNIRKVVKTMKLGANDFLEKPFDLKALVEKIKSVERTIIKEKQIETINNARLETIDMDFPNIIGKSEPLRKVLSKVPKVAKTDLSVLIVGESGAGKELIADLVQFMSDRKDQPFVKVNSAAIPPDLLESELFGYEKGAFTGANTRKKGKLEDADKGTIFLDEIGEMPYAMQSKLLSFLQNSEVQRLGSTQPVKVDTRVIAATNRNLPELIKEGKFREDLYFRLNTVILSLPNLSERKEDIPDLIDYFLDKYSKKHNVEPKKLSTKAQDILMKYHYPGNIRELENIIQYTMLFSLSDVVYVEDLPIEPSIKKKLEDTKSPTGPISSAFSDSLKEYIESIERDIIIKFLEECNWNQSKTSSKLGMSEFTLRYKMKKYEIKRK